jgi:hypothetical protein
MSSDPIEAGRAVPSAALPVDVAAHAAVTEARRENGTTWLVLAGGRKVAASDASGLRQP